LSDTTSSSTTKLVLEGIAGTLPPSREQRGDIEFGWPLLQQVVELGIGSAMAVRERDVIAVEATEGTRGLIERAGELCRMKGWVLLKTACPAGDDAEAVPTIDVDLIDALEAAGGRCLAVEAGRVRVTDEVEVLEAAGRARIAVVKVTPG
jgi:DUF1009 family protein